jgi:hypothetical protein
MAKSLLPCCQKMPALPARSTSCIPPTPSSVLRAVLFGGPDRRTDNYDVLPMIFCKSDMVVVAVPPVAAQAPVAVLARAADPVRSISAASALPDATTARLRAVLVKLEFDLPSWRRSWPWTWTRCNATSRALPVN